MMKKKHERKFGTQFEQVPLEVVKRIAQVDVSNDEKAGTDIVELASRKNEPYRRLHVRTRESRYRAQVRASARRLFLKFLWQSLPN
jgi:hypothetical protein